MVECAKNRHYYVESGFFEKYMSGVGLDVGYAGYNGGSPIRETAIGIDMDYPGYDGITLPFEDGSQDYVYTSHVLEHISRYAAALRDWYRVLKVGGFMIVVVPHQYLYEKKVRIGQGGSRWNHDHKRFYTPSSLLAEIEDSLEPNSYRVRHLRDNDARFDYSIPPDVHSTGCYEIELVIQKIEKTNWELALN